MTAARKLHPQDDEPRPWYVTSAEYRQLLDAGVLDGKPVQLIEGVIVEMSPIGEPHSAAVSALTRLLSTALGISWAVRVQCGLDPGGDNLPQPDVAVMTVKDEEKSYPLSPRAAPFVCEVSDSTLRFDRGRKLALYARMGVQEYVVANLKRSELEVYTAPLKSGVYRKKRIIGRGDAYDSSVLPGVVLRPNEIFHSRR